MMARSLSKPLLAAIVVLLAASALRADDWPQWLGPRRDSVWREQGILRKFPAAGPKFVWRVPISGGYAGPAVARGRVVVTDYLIEQGQVANDPNSRTALEGKERVLCFDAADGRLVWKHEDACAYSISYAAGPRATPTIDGERIYSLGAEGNLLCLDFSSGKVNWQLDLKQAFHAPTPIWGFCSHPLVEGNTLYCLAGGEGSVAVALDKHTGKERWRSLSAPDCGYSAPMMIQAGGRRQLIVWHPKALNGLDPETGKQFWSVPLEPNYGMSILSPRQMGEYLFAGGIVAQGVLLRLAADEPRVDEVWRSSATRGLGPVESPVVPVGDVMFGIDRDGELTAVDLPTGRRLWQTYAATTGNRRTNSASAFMVRNDDRFYLFNERGELVIARLMPEKYEELDRARILEPTNEAFGREVVWSHPAFASRAMFARNDRELVCVSLAE